MSKQSRKPVVVAPGWIAHRPAGSVYASAVYVAAECEHGRQVAHSLRDAVGCGLIRAARAGRGLTQTQAAAEIGISVDALRSWEQGQRRPTGLYAQALARWLLSGPAHE